MANAKQHPQVVNVSEVEVRNLGMGSKFGAATKLLGFNWTRVGAPIAQHRQRSFTLSVLLDASHC